MANTITISVSQDDLKNLQHIKVTKDMGASSVMRFGIQSLLNQNSDRNTLNDLKASNDKLYRIISRLQEKVFKLENESVEK